MEGNDLAREVVGTTDTQTRDRKCVWDSGLIVPVVLCVMYLCVCVCADKGRGRSEKRKNDTHNQI